MKKIFLQTRQKIRRFRRFYLVNVFLISYPKMGRTWLRVMIERYLTQYIGVTNNYLSLYRFTLSQPNIPVIDVTHEDSALGYLKHWQELETNKKKYHNKKVIFLTRDLRDTLVSAYFQATKRRIPHGVDEGDFIFDGHISTFIRDEVLGLPKIARFWQIWQDGKQYPSDFLLVRYEKLHEDPHQVLREVIEFMGLPVQPELIKEAVHFASFDNMRKIEKKQGLQQDGAFGGNALLPGDVKDEQSYKVREGKVHNFKKYLSEEDLAFIDSYIQEHLIGNSFI